MSHTMNGTESRPTPDNTTMASFKNLIRSDLANSKAASNIAFNERIMEMKNAGETVHHLGFGQAPFPIMEEVIDAFKENAWQSGYQPVAGIPQLRQAICRFHRHFDGLIFDPEQVIVAPGSKELIFLLQTVFNGDVLMSAPTWTTYKPQSRLSGRRAFVLPTRREDLWRLTAQSIEQVVAENNLSENKLLILCNPDNPTGTDYDADHLKALATVCRKHNIIVISDEIYARLHYQQAHQSLAKFYPEGTILSAGMSKWASAGGWRLGYHIYPRELDALRHAVRSAASQTYTCAPAPAMYAFAKVLPDLEVCEAYILHTTRVLKAVAEFSYKELSSVGVKGVRPAGGYYIFADFECLRETLAARGITTGEQMCDAILDEAKVALLAGGPAFLYPEEALAVRLCYVAFDGQPGLEFSRRLGLETPLPTTFVQEFCTGMYEAIKILCKWVTDQKKT